MKKLILFISFITLSLLSHATIHVVDSLNNSGTGSLRAAADSAFAGDTIRFNPNLIANGSDSIELITEIYITNKGLTIIGLYTETDTLFISGNNNSRIFRFNNTGNVVLDSLVIINGYSSNDGGAIYKSADSLFVRNSVISNSTANFNGGGIYANNSVVMITNSTISGNTAMIGGGMRSHANSSTYIEVINSTISGNTSSYAGGGGISSESVDDSSSVMIINSTISGNACVDRGGGVSSKADYSFVTVINSTISGNSATLFGGGVYSNSSSYANSNASSLVITNSTITDNTAGLGDGFYSFSSTSTSSSTALSSVTIKGSIVARNGSDNNGMYYSHSSGFSVIGNSLTGTYTAAQLNLQPLAFNGGTTQTMAPGIGSIALSTGDSNDISDAQNGPIVGVRDIGAAESCFAIPSFINVSDCYSYTLPSGNATCNQSGVYKDTVLTTCGADSMITINLTITNRIIEAFDACNSFTWRNGVTYTQSNYTAQDTVVVTGGCDSIFVLNLTVHSNQNTTDVQVVCDSLTWVNGITYYSSTNNSVQDTLTSQFGCDSVVSLDLTINNSVIVVDTVSACLFYLWSNGQIYISDNNTAIQIFPRLNACDSILRLNLELNYGTAGVDTQVVCDSLVWIDGNTYYSNNNTAVHTLIGGNNKGCDSIVTLDLTINGTSTVDVISTCDSYTWINGITYTANNNTAVDTLVNAAGCDSIITLNLTILSSTTSTDVISSCNPITWLDGNTYSINNNTATYTLVNAAGCDSNVTLNFILLQPTTGTDVITSCTEITWIDGITYNQTTNGPTFTIPNTNGCDSIITLDFTLLEVDTTVIRNYLTLTAQATNATYQWIDCVNGAITGETNAAFTATVNGDYQVEVTQNGCVDSSACFTIDNVGITEPELIGISLYPNPTSDVLNIDKGTNTSLEITITNSAGAVVHHSTSLNHITTINMAKMATGMYVVTLKNELGMKVEKVVKR